jgi:hypothetical protein
VSGRWGEPARPSLLEAAGHGGTVALVLLLLALLAGCAAVAG